MSMLRSLIALSAILLLPVAHAELTERTDYRKLSPVQPTDNPGKLEVIEFFSYGCPHCYQAFRPVEKWAAALPKNAVFVRVPLSLGYREWGALSRAYYSLQALGELPRLDAALFDAIHKEQLRLFDEESITQWMSKQGIVAEKFRETFNSQGVSTKVMRAEQMARNYLVSSVPTIAVDGRYVVVAEGVKTFGELLDIATQVVDKAAKETPRK